MKKGDDLRTIDFGIDLGTTNSAIARQMGVHTEVIGADGDVLLPSIVHIGADGQVMVGREARARRADDTTNVAQEFKRLMGTGEQVPFSNGRSYSPEALSAEILKSLVRRAEASFGSPIDAAVITIPAMFQLPQCEATRRAAALAGIAQAPLLQEPIAAAIASVGSAELRDGYWLVYDLGGGTFDVSLVRSRGGRLQVIDHDGDNHLGGKDLDRVVARHVVGLIRADGRIGAFERNDPVYAETFGRLRLEAERTRIALSDAESADLHVEAPGHAAFAVSIERSELERLIEPILGRTVQICQAILARNRLQAAQMNRLVLVGGPTQTPYLKTFLAAQLGIETRHYVDPTQAVVIGAAIYAATQKVNVSRSVSSEALSAEIAYEAMTNNPRPMIAGKLTGPRGPGAWLVGVVKDGESEPRAWSPVRDNGSFALQLDLAENRLSAFELVAQCDGKRQPLTQASFVMVHGTTIAKPVLSQSVGVMLADGFVRWYLRKGSVLPARMSQTHATTFRLVRGQSGVAVHVPLVQGESEQGDRNTVIGEIRIAAVELSRDLPAGSEVLVTLGVDEYSTTRAEAYIPALDMTFSDIVTFGLATQSGEKLQDALEDQKKRLSELERLVTGLEGPQNDVDENVQLIDDLLKDGGADERLQAGDLLRKMALMIDAIASGDRVSELAQRFRDSHARSTQLLRDGDKEIARELEAITSEFFDAVNRSDLDIAAARLKAAEAVEWRVLQREPYFWRDLFEDLLLKVQQSPRAAEGIEPIEAGKQAIIRNDLSGLIDACFALLRLLPETVAIPAAVMSHVA
ncbi:MAG: Hsp70 family protein [Rhizomicrobium sp.]